MSVPLVITVLLVRLGRPAVHLARTPPPLAWSNVSFAVKGLLVLALEQCSLLLARLVTTVKTAQIALLGPRALLVLINHTSIDPLCLTVCLVRLASSAMTLVAQRQLASVMQVTCAVEARVCRIHFCLHALWDITVPLVPQMRLSVQLVQFAKRQEQLPGTTVHLVILVTSVRLLACHDLQANVCRGSTVLKKSRQNI